MDRNYKNEVYQCVAAEIIPSDCNAIEFYNPSTTVTATINLRAVPPGTAWSITGHKNEKDTTKYQVSFSAAGGKLIVTRKYYQ